MATETLPHTYYTDRVTAHHTVSVEPYSDGRPEVHEAVVERDHGVVVQVWCCDADVCGCSIEDAARAYAVTLEADFVAGVSR